MPITDKIALLQRLQVEVDALDKDLGINPRGTVLYLAHLNLTGHDVLIVEADGCGGGTTSVVQGNYPVDYMTKLDKHFLTEEEAISAADTITERGVLPEIALADCT
jgi:hypothetical protein